MDTRQLSRIDLNLLVALQVLLEEANVSKAADRLFITQSAMSKTLGRLRELFEDPLFTRSSHGMVATPRALELKEQLLELLQNIEGLVAPQEFDPSSFRGEFKIAVAEYVGMAVLPLLMEELQEEAPHARIVAISRVENQLEKLADGDLDLAIHMKFAHYTKDFILDEVGRLPPVLLMRKDHPLRRIHNPTIEQTFSYPRVRLYIPDLEELEVRQTGPLYNASPSMTGDIVFETSHMFSAIEVVKRTNCVLVGPPFITQHPQLGTGLVGVPVAMDVADYLHYVMVSHQRTENSLPHRWLREKIVAIAHRESGTKESGNPYADYRVAQHMTFIDED